MVPALVLLLAAQVSSSATPVPTLTPTASVSPAGPTATPVAAADPYRPRSLSDLAKERRLGRLTGTGAALVTTPVTPEAEFGAPGTSQPVPPSSSAARRCALLRVEDVEDNGAVADGRLSVFGAVRNTGRIPLCRVRIFLRLYDDHGVLLSTGETTTDLKVVGVGDSVTFGGSVKVPVGLRGSSERSPDPLASGRSATNWARAGRVQVEVIDASDECI